MPGQPEEQNPQQKVLRLPATYEEWGEHPGHLLGHDEEKLLSPEEHRKTIIESFFLSCLDLMIENQDMVFMRDGHSIIVAQKDTGKSNQLAGSIVYECGLQEKSQSKFIYLPEIKKSLDILLKESGNPVPENTSFEYALSLLKNHPGNSVMINYVISQPASDMMLAMQTPQHRLDMPVLHLGEDDPYFSMVDTGDISIFRRNALKFNNSRFDRAAMPVKDLKLKAIRYLLHARSSFEENSMDDTSLYLGKFRCVVDAIGLKAFFEKDRKIGRTFDREIMFYLDTFAAALGEYRQRSNPMNRELCMGCINEISSRLVF